MKNVVPYYQRKKALIKAKQRQTKLTTVDGKVIYGLTKRQHPEQCELCGKNKNKEGKQLKLDYHHWIPAAPQIGVWLCNKCHVLAEFLDHGNFVSLFNQYTYLKAYAKDQYHEKG